MQNTPILSARSLTRKVASQPQTLTILNQVNLTLKKGESLAIQGASGSGKSTLLAILAGLDLPQQGEVHILNQSITQLSEDRRARLRAENIAFVFQSFHLINDLNAQENVALPLELFGHPYAQKTAWDWLKKLGLAERARHFPKQLSGGEQQRVALCRAFAVQPALLFADEPTANLDVSTSSTVLDALFSLQRQHHTSMVIATHDPYLAAQCDTVLHLEAGQLVNADKVISQKDTPHQANNRKAGQYE